MYKVFKDRTFEVQVFVEYEVTPIQRSVAKDMYEHLLDVVWGEWRHVDEDVRLMNKCGNLDEACDIVRYQFADIEEAEERMEAVARLIQSAFDTWTMPTCNKDQK